MSDAITKTWNGGRDTPDTPGNFVTGDFFDVNNWHYADGGADTPPQFAPGDTGVINSGTAIVTGATVEGVNVILQTGDRSPDSASPATLKLRDAVLDTGTTVDKPGSSSFGYIEVQGIAVNQGAVVLDSPSGPGELRIKIDPSSLFANTGTISATAGSSSFGVSDLYIQGSAHSLFLNDGDVGLGGAYAHVSVPVRGNGTFTITSPGSNTSPNRLEFSRAVGAGQTIVLADTTDAGSPAVTAATLLLDKPMRFAATISGFNAPDRIELPNMSLSGEYYTPTGATTGDLVLLNGSDVVADLHLATGPSIAANYATEDFAVSNNGGSTFIDVASHLAPLAMAASGSWAA